MRKFIKDFVLHKNNKAIITVTGVILIIMTIVLVLNILPGENLEENKNKIYEHIDRNEEKLIKGNANQDKSSNVDKEAPIKSDKSLLEDLNRKEQEIVKIDKKKDEKEFKKGKPNYNSKKNVTSSEDDLNNRIIIKDPKQVIDHLHSGLRNISTDNILNYKPILNLINKTYDLEKMTKMIIGDAWNEINFSTQNKMISVFQEFIAKNYIKRFSKLASYRFTYESKKNVGSNYVLIKTKLKLQKEEIKLEYLLSEKDKSWKIFDVLLDGSISEIATKKSEFSIFIEGNNIDKLIDALEKKNLNMQK